MLSHYLHFFNQPSSFLLFLLSVALHRAAHEDNVQACRILLSYNVDPGIVSLQGYTAAQVATENVNKILQTTKPSELSSFHPSLPQFSYYSVINYLYFYFVVAEPVASCVDVESQMLEAAKAGDSEQVQRLLTAYPQIVNCRDLDGR